MSRHQQPGGGLSEAGSTRTHLKKWGQAALQASLGLVAGTAMVMFAVTAVQIGLENEPADAIRPVGPSVSADPLALTPSEQAIDNPQEAPQQEAPDEAVESVGTAVARAGAELVTESPAAPAPEAPATGDGGSDSLVASVDGVALKPAVPENPGDRAGVRGNHQGGESPDTDEIEEGPPGDSTSSSDPGDDSEGESGDRDPGSGSEGSGDESGSDSEGSGSEGSGSEGSGEAEESDEPKPAPKPEEDEPDQPDEPEEAESPPPDSDGGGRDSGGGEAPGGVDGQD